MANKEPETKENMNYFYVLWCKDQSLYAGYTTDLKRREDEHNLGVGAKYTRVSKRRPLKMIYAEAFLTKSLAMSAEYAFKQLTRRQKEKYLKDNGVLFPLSNANECLIKEVDIIEDTKE